MRNYWLKIVLGAVAVFAVGMIITSIIRRIRHVATSDETIEFPLAFIPFKVDGERLGELKRVRVIRATADSVTAVHLRAALDDTMAAARVRDCILVIRDVEHLDEHSTFECVTAADTTGQDLITFGTVRLGEGGYEVPFLLPRAEVGHAHASDEGWERAAEYGDSIAERIEEEADSIAEAAELLADSVQTVEMERAESIRAEGTRRADSVRSARMNAPAP